MLLEIRQAELTRLANDHDLDLSRVTITVEPAPPGKKRRGVHRSDGKITLFVGLEEQAANSLRHVTAQLNRTLLHELRHEWQAQHWGRSAFSDKPGAYWTTRHEEDAREWADLKSGSYRLVRVKPRPVSRSRFSRLSAVQAAVRPSR